ncbi:chondroitin AC/alginate lyase [Dentipellis sp. KUC8613]|nr:chondroitin AC/alginate lyase [Dentipellis sp. KUC8613]
MKLATLSALAGLLPAAVHSFGFTSYDNTFIDPQWVLAKNFSDSTKPAQQTIIQWADQLNQEGPWSVMNKPFDPPSGDKHDYMSWAPYWWPNCTGAGNTTALSDDQIWRTCNYYQRDGEFNPDVRTVNDTGAFDALSNAVLYNALAWVINGSSTYSSHAASFVKTWFLDADTAMNPNLNYAQMERGPKGQNGSHTGVLDLKGMAKIATGLLILQGGNSPDWTSDLSSQLATWTTTYIKWLTTSPIALGEADAPNNHGTYYYNQLAALHLIVNDTQGAQDVVKSFFSKQYMSQINSTGEQPYEAVRTRPYHYRNYNLAAMLTNAAIGNYTGFDAYSQKTSAGTTIQDALNFAMTIPANDEPASELFPNVAAVASVYGDPDGKYAKFLAGKEDDYPAEPWFFWLQPLSDSGLHVVVNTTGTGTSTAAGGGSSSSSSRSSNGAIGTGLGVGTVVMTLGALLGAIVM